MARRILIVDDNPDNIQIVASMLGPGKYKIQFALSGDDAIAWARDEVFDLILMDIMMPGMDGFQACAEIKDGTLNSATPLIFLTAKSDVESISRGFALGGVDYVIKPFHHEELLARVNTHLELREKREHLQRLNNELEDRIKDRTIELRNANIHLQKANRDLQQLSRAKAEFLRIISNELRTPVAGIMASINQMAFANEDPVWEKYFQVLSQNLDRLEDFSGLALDITNLMTLGEAQLNFQTLDVSEMIKQLRVFFQKELSDQEMTLEWIISGSKPYTFRGDHGYLLKAMNLIMENSLRLSSRGSTLSFDIRFDEFQVNILFQDKGPGFTEQVLQSMFQPFSPGENNNGSRGLGLYFVRLIVEAHTGEIEAFNDQGGGAVVKITLPR